MRPESTLTARNFVGADGTHLTDRDIIAGQVYKVDYINALWRVTSPLAGGIGDITAVNTATDSGLTGGVNFGAANLHLNFYGLPAGVVANIYRADEIAFIDRSVSQHHKLSYTQLGQWLTTGESTMDASDGHLRVAPCGIEGAQIADNIIAEVKLSITNDPANAQLLSWNGTTMEWVTQSSTGIDEYADSVSVSQSGSDLTVTIGRTESLSDLTTTVTLPAGGAGEITAVNVGNGLAGDRTTGDVTVSLPDGGIGRSQLQGALRARSLVTSGASWTVSNRRINLNLGSAFDAVTEGDFYSFMVPNFSSSAANAQIGLLLEDGLNTNDGYLPDGARATVARLRARRLLKSTSLTATGASLQ